MNSRAALRSLICATVLSAGLAAAGEGVPNAAASNADPHENEPGIESPTTPAADTDSTTIEAEHALLQKIEQIRAEQGNLTRDLIAPLRDLAALYVTIDECQNAIPILKLATQLSQRLDGFNNSGQLEFFDPLIECSLARDLLPEFNLALEQFLRIHESLVGDSTVQLLPALTRGAQWYARADEYDEARKLYTRAIKIVRKSGGPNDGRQVELLRGLARTYQEETQYRSPEASLTEGERLLERAVAIQRANPDTPSAERIETLLELGDWYQMEGAVRDAGKMYREVWQLSTAEGATPTALLAKPEVIHYRARIGRALRRPPPEANNLRHYWVDFTFTVTREGEVVDLIATDSNASPEFQSSLAENVRQSRYRPRFVNGEPVETRGVYTRQGAWAK